MLLKFLLPQAQLSGQCLLTVGFSMEEKFCHHSTQGSCHIHILAFFPLFVAVFETFLRQCHLLVFPLGRSLHFQEHCI